MTYAVQLDMTNRFGERELIELTDRDNAVAIQAAVLDQAFADADAFINSYLKGRYTVPLATVPESIVTAAAHIARYYLYTDNIPDAVNERFKYYTLWLKDISAGRALIGDDDGVEASPTDTSGVTHSAPTATISLDTLADY